MPRTTIALTDGTFQRLRTHLLSGKGLCEEAAFLFARADESATGHTLTVVNDILIPPKGFARRSRFYLELTDETRALVIKRAHDLDAGLIECHSHPGQRGACFSWSDLHGFDEFVPHVQWRLPGRAYAAVVFASDSVDALVWPRQGDAAARVDAILTEQSEVQPTQLTLANWSELYERNPV